jgi:hypothetical protein
MRLLEHHLEHPGEPVPETLMDEVYAYLESVEPDYMAGVRDDLLAAGLLSCDRVRAFGLGPS